MARALDHIVLPCGDLAAGARLFEELGFQVGRRNRHPWGTENHIVQFDGAFLELIAFAADAAPPAPQDDAFPFAGFLAGRGTSPAPSGMIVLRGEGAEADAEAFREAGIGTGRRLHFAREAAGPDGRPRRVSFSLAFAAAPALPHLGFFTCTQHAPENFWNPALQRHPNGVSGIAAVVIAAADPACHAGFLSRFAAAPARSLDGEGLAFDLGNAALEVVTPAAARRRDGVGAQGADGRLATLRFAGSAPRRVAPPGCPALVFG